VARTSASAGTRPWYAVVLLAFDQVVAWGVLYYAYSVLCAPLAGAFGVSTRFVAFAFSLSLAVSGLLAAGVGRVLDRRGARSVLLAGAVAGPAAFAALAFAPGEISLLCVFAAIGVAQALALYEPAFQAVVEWFPTNQERSRALLVLTCIAGFSSTVFLPLCAFLVGRLGWRTSILTLALLLATVVIPIRFALPRQRGVRTKNAVNLQPSARGTRAASLLGVAFGLQSFAATGGMLYLTLHFVELGESLSGAALFAGLAGAAQVPGRLLLAPLQKLVGTGLRLPLLFVVQGIALLGIAVAPWPVAALATLLFGAVGGSMTLEKAVVVLEWFGAQNFGTRSGFVASLALVARAAAPLGAELLREFTGNYAGAFCVLALVLVSGAVFTVAANAERTAAEA
jgi:cyanate permease